MREGEREREPTVVAIAYGLDKKGSGERNVPLVDGVLPCSQGCHHGSMALQLHISACGGPLCTIEDEVGLVLRAVRSRRPSMQLWATITGVWRCSSAYPLAGVPCAPSKLRLAFRAVERAACGTAAPHIHLWGSPGGKAVWNSSQRRSCGPFGPFWARLGPFGPFWALFGPCLPLWAFVGPFWPVRAFLGVFLETFGKCALIASNPLDSPRYSLKRFLMWDN